MFLPFYLTLVTAILFYLLLPVFSGLSVRLAWLRFRRRLEALSREPILSYRDMVHQGTHNSGGKRFRFYGRIEAVEGQDLLWLRNPDMSALVNLSNTFLYVLGRDCEGEAAWSPERAGSVEKVSWKRVQVLPEGTKLFVAGILSIDAGRPVFMSVPGEPLLTILYDDDEKDLISRVDAGGRRRNEYWNPLTPVWMACGLGFSSILLFLFGRGSILPTVRTLAYLVALAPLLPFIPPELSLFFLYRYLWRKALALRIAKDIYRLPLRYFSEMERTEAKLPDGGCYRRYVLPAASDSQARALEGYRLILPPGGNKISQPYQWTLFEPVESADPAAERIAILGEPEQLAERCRRRSYLTAVAAGITLLAAVVSGYILAFIIWRVISTA